MKKTLRQLSFLGILIFALSSFVSGAGRDYYQIQTYRINGKAQEARVDNFLKSAYLPALHRAGIKTVGVFKPLPNDTIFKNQIIVLLPLTSPDQLDKLNSTLLKDAVYQTDGADFLGAPFDNVPFQRKESILLKAFPEAPEMFIPKHQTKPSERIYELRSYEGPTQNLFLKKVKMFNEGGEVKLFKSLDFNAVFYAEVISGPTMPNLMYLTTFSDMASHNAHWDAFRNHPDWKKLSSLDEYKHTVSKSVIMLLNPTDYSDF
ncbi:MAG: NIPSNAP family protein [Mariniphaga sp.]